MTAPKAETCSDSFSRRAKEACMYAASDTSPAAQPKEMGMKTYTAGVSRAKLLEGLDEHTNANNQTYLMSPTGG